MKFPFVEEPEAASPGCGPSAADTAPVVLTVSASGRLPPAESSYVPTATQPSNAHDTASTAPAWFDPLPALSGSGGGGVVLQTPPASRSSSGLSLLPVLA